VNRLRLLVAAVALAAAIFAALFASDLRSWQGAVRDGDLRFTQAPTAAGWNASTVLPAGLSRDLLGISGQLALRRAARAFVAVQALGNGFDNGYSESRKRADLEVALTNLARSPDHRRDSAADNLLGILAFADSQQTGASAPAPVERSTADFQSAVQLDPTNEDAKFNLEWLLHELAPHGTRGGGTGSSAGPAKGHKGAGGGLPGKGY
jgi:ribosomal protein S18 acetylase RimI-like enzyme